MINELSNRRFQLLEGRSASGKSVIVSNIGFKLARRGYNVFILRYADQGRDWDKVASALKNFVESFL